MLKGLALHDRRRSDWNGDQWQLLFRDYREELGGFPEFKIDLGYQVLRRRKQPFFPSIGEFLEAIEKGHREWMAYDAGPVAGPAPRCASCGESLPYHHPGCLERRTAS